MLDYSRSKWSNLVQIILCKQLLFCWHFLIFVGSEFETLFLILILEIIGNLSSLIQSHFWSDCSFLQNSMKIHQLEKDKYRWKANNRCDERVERILFLEKHCHKKNSMNWYFLCLKIYNNFNQKFARYHKENILKIPILCS